MTPEELIAGLRSDRAPGDHGPPPLPPRGRAMPPVVGDLVAAFGQAARAVGAEVLEVHAADLDAALGALGIPPGRDRPSTREALLAAALGLSEAALGIASTGSVLLNAGPLEPRLRSTAPAHHVVILRAERLVPHLADAFAALASAGLPSAATLVTGPSKTADIEGVLVTGVHGPGRVTVVVVR